MQYTQQYFEAQKLEMKHFHETQIWIDYFNPKKVLDIGCGMGHRVFVFRENEIESYGFDLQDAINYVPYNPEWFKVGNIDSIPFEEKFDLVLVYDVLEHLEIDLDIALKEIKRISSGHIIFSIPFYGDPNLFNDKTHKLFKTREWWFYKIGKYFKIIETPKHFPFHQQMIICRNKDE